MAVAGSTATAAEGAAETAAVVVTAEGEAATVVDVEVRYPRPYVGGGGWFGSGAAPAAGMSSRSGC
ncbi:hypothetical protein GCM10009872_43790 [Actinopolymorpha rutila]